MGRRRIVDNTDYQVTSVRLLCSSFASRDGVGELLSVLGSEDKEELPLVRHAHDELKLIPPKWFPAEANIHKEVE